MMLIFEEIQIDEHFRQRSSKTSPLAPPLRTCIVWDDFQGNKKTERGNDTLITRKGEMLIASLIRS